MEIDKKMVFQTFFGTKELPTGILIITSIGKIYRKINSKYPIIEKTTKGWWQRVKIKINSKNVSVLKIPPGPHIKDCLQSIDHKKVKKIIFLGFSGSLNKKLKIGDIVILPKEKYKIAEVSQMILKSAYLRKMKRQKIDLLDMETSFLHQWGKDNRVPIITIIIITDLPEFLPFFLCGKKELHKINNSINRVVKQLNQLTKLNQEAKLI